MYWILSQGNIGVNEDCEVFNSPAVSKKIKIAVLKRNHCIKKYFPLFKKVPKYYISKFPKLQYGFRTEWKKIKTFCEIASLCLSKSPIDYRIDADLN